MYNIGPKPLNKRTKQYLVDADLLTIASNRQDNIRSVWHRSITVESKLNFACQYGLTDLFDQLVEANKAKAKLYLKKALTNVCFYGQFNMVKHLVKNYGCDVNYQCGINSWYPIHAAISIASTTPASIIIIQYLIDNGASLDVIYDNKNPIDYCLFFIKNMPSTHISKFMRILNILTKKIKNVAANSEILAITANEKPEFAIEIMDILHRRNMKDLFEILQEVEAQISVDECLCALANLSFNETKEAEFCI